MGSNLDPSRLRSQVHSQNDNSSVIGIQPIRVRKLVYNLPRETVVQKIREAGRLTGVGKREQGFYLLDLKRRKLYLDEGCSSFRQFVRLTRTWSRGRPTSSSGWPRTWRSSRSSTT